MISIIIAITTPIRMIICIIVIIVIIITIFTLVGINFTIMSYSEYYDFFLIGIIRGGQTLRSLQLARNVARHHTATSFWILGPSYNRS